MSWPLVRRLLIARFLVCLKAGVLAAVALYSIFGFPVLDKEGGLTL